MEFLGIGPLELLFVIVIIIVVVGPRDIQKTMRSLGRGLNALYKSDLWKAFNEVSKQLRGLPNRLAREAELDEIQRAAQEVKETVAAANPLSAWTPEGNSHSGMAAPSVASPSVGGGGNAESLRTDVAAGDRPPAESSAAPTGAPSTPNP